MTRAAKPMFGTKAETLERLLGHPASFVIPPFLFFTVGDWRRDRAGMLARVTGKLGGDRHVVVRSSARNEDSENASKAGQFESVLDVPAHDADAVAAAIDRVIASYEPDDGNQVMVQAQVCNPAVSGVIMSRCIDDGSPYYVISYDDESGRTDTVTGGTKVSKTVYIHRKAAMHHIESDRLRAMLLLARELEGLVGLEAIDIEFGMGIEGEIYLFQVRRITTHATWVHDVEITAAEVMPRLQEELQFLQRAKPGLPGAKTVLCNMADWNPAEMIGPLPRPLAASLYRDLITRDAWRTARMKMGYRSVAGEELMHLVAGRCYIDVRNSVNSFLPGGLDDATAATAVDHCLDHLSAHPEFHDKIEFEIVPTIGGFDTRAKIARHFGSVLDAGRIADYAAALDAVTRANVTVGETGSLVAAQRRVEQLAELQRAPATPAADTTPAKLARVSALLEQCRELGTEPFAILARHGFIAEAMLRDMVGHGILPTNRTQAFRESVRTIAGDLVEDMDCVVRGQLDVCAFMAKYGHLRPGTYDIMSRRYDQRANFFANHRPHSEAAHTPFVLTAAERGRLDRALYKAGLNLDAETFFAYADRSIVWREYGKFVFTRHLSDALEEIASLGVLLGLTRGQMSFLTLDDLRSAAASGTGGLSARLAERAEQNKEAFERAKTVKLGYILRHQGDLFVVPTHRAAPTFIGRNRVEAEVCHVRADAETLPDVAERIVCIDSADPGFDWLFTKGIVGLVTRFGGANSHMAIRCAEFGLPAAIGCGDLLFERVAGAVVVELNAAEHTVSPLR